MRTLIVSLMILNFVKICMGQFCGGFIPTAVENCTNLNTLVYNCCYCMGLNWGTKTPISPICYGFTTDTDMSQISDFWNAGYPYSSIACGTSVKGHMTLNDRCGMSNPINSSDCYNSGGSKCCYVAFDGFELCLKKDMDNDDLWRGVK